MVLVDYMMLDLDPTASDEEIREQYLALIKAHPPEHDPEGFQDVTQAYERIKDRHARIRHQLFGYRFSSDIEGSFAYLLRAARPKRKRAGLRALLKAAIKS
jgi:DnaJ-class molecular chaperone